MKTHVLIESGTQKWLVFGHDSERPVNVSGTNQIAIISDNAATLIDPGGIEVFPAFLSSLTESVAVGKISNIVLTSADPSAVSSLPLWRQVCTEGLQISAPALWADVLSHLDADCVLNTIGDKGDVITMPDDRELTAIPAHHLHSPAAFSIYDTKLKALYSGSIGSTINTANASGEFLVNDFDAHISFLESYHDRWFASHRARAAWITQVQELDIDLLVPHRGPAFSGDDVEKFLEWFSAYPIGSMYPALGAAKTEPSADVSDLMAEFDISSEPKPEPKPEEQQPEKPKGEDDADLANLMGESDAIPRGDPEPGGEFRLVTRSDFDGLACAVVLEALEMIDDILFVHPNDMQEGRIPINDKDITTNLPYVPGCHLAFDHHLSEVARLGRKYDNHIIIPEAPSAARVVYEYYGGKEGLPQVSEEMMRAVDQGDSAAYEMEDVLNPQGWALLNFIMDSRSGLGRFKGFRIPNYELMMSLIEYCGEHTIEEILEIEDVRERAEFFLEQQVMFKEQLQRCTTVHDNLAVVELQGEETVYVGNRFMIYALFPQCNISMHCMWGRDKQNVVYAVGKSIFDKSSKTNVGELMLQYGGGGHHAAGTCQSDPIMADTVKQALIQKITEDG